MCKFIQNFPICLKDFIICLIFVAIATPVAAQSDSTYLRYINSYKDIAVEQMRRHSIPASITLAQGGLESQCGQAELAIKGNNHFGIKCGGWDGPTMFHDDDELQECFRVYDSALQSYEDHSAFLKKKRYMRLFDLDPTDYKGWAAGLRQCGYATDPLYPQKLIDIIERFSLYNLDRELAAEAAETPPDDMEIAAEAAGSHFVRRKDGLFYVSAREGDSYKSIADELGLSEKDLRAWNNAHDKTSAPSPGQAIFLQPKQ